MLEHYHLTPDQVKRLSMRFINVRSEVKKMQKLKEKVSKSKNKGKR